MGEIDEVKIINVFSLYTNICVGNYCLQVHCAFSHGLKVCQGVNIMLPS